MTGGSGTVTLTQPLTAMRQQRINPDVPYWFSVAVNPTIGSASGGTLTLSMGSSTVAQTVALMSSGWQVLSVGDWPTNFNADPMSVSISWTSSSSGYLVIDDAIFSPWDELDGTFWMLVGGTTPWLVDDTLAFTDTGGAPGTGSVQWWLWRAGLGYLPSDSSPTMTDP